MNIAHFPIAFIGLPALVEIAIAICVVAAFSFLMLKLHLLSSGMTKSIDLFQTITRSSNTAIWRYNFQADSFTESYGTPFPFKKFDKQTFINSFLPEYHARLHEIFSNIESGKTDKETFTGKYSEGNDSEIHFVSIQMVVSKKNGVINGIIGAYRKLDAEFEFRQTDEKILRQFSAMFNATRVGLAIYNANDVLIDINKAGIEIFGIPDKETLLTSQPKLNSDPNYAKLKERYLENGDDSDLLIEYDFDLTNDGQGLLTNRKGKRWLICNIHPVLDVNGNLECTIISTTDVSTDINRNQQFERLYNENSLILNSLPVGVALFDKDNNQTYVNDKYIDIFGISDKVDFLKGQHNIHKNPLMSDEQKQEIVLKDNTEFNVIADFNDNRVRDFYGSSSDEKKILHVNFAKMPDKDGNPDISLVILSDITSTEKTHRIIEDMNKNMSLLIKAGQLTAWILDFRTGHRKLFQGPSLLPDILSGNDYSRYFHPDDAILLDNLIQKAKEGKEEEFHNVIRYLDSSIERGYRHLEFYWLVLKENGEVTKLACINRDITNETLYRKQLEMNKFRTMLAFQEAGMTQYDYDVKSGYFTASYSENLISGKTIISMDEYTSFFHPDDVIKYADTIKKMKEGVDFSCSIEYRIRSSNNDDWQIMLLTNVPLEKDENGNVLVYTGLRRNNTKWLELNRDIQKKNELLRVIINRMPCLFFLKDIDDDYRYVMANKMFCDSLGKTQQEVIGHADHELLDNAENANKYYLEDVETVAKGSKSVREVLFKNGQKSTWHTTKSVIDQHYIIGMSLDITELDTIMEELREARNKAERSDMLKSAFLANMSHEIRTPLNSIVGFADLIVNSDNESEKQEFSKIISNNSELLLKLISDILDISKIEAGFIGIKNAPVNITELFEEYKKSFSKNIMKGVEFSCVVPYKSCIIETDKNRLTQVVQNYMSNAIKYTPKGHIILGYECVENGLRVYVKDTGIGISEENKTRVFGRFEKFDSFAQGTGLGLSICKAIAEAVGGKIGFESTINEGSLFWFWLPCHPIIDEDSISEETKKAPNNMSGIKSNSEEAKTAKILVAEDNDSNFKLLQAILKGYDVERATNGLEAVNMTRENTYYLIFMDMKMPIMGGLEATRKIRDFDNRTPIIALTANAFDTDREDALFAGCTRYVAKPINNSTINELLKDLL